MASVLRNMNQNALQNLKPDFPEETSDKRVLVAEDAEDIRLVIVTMMETLGYDVIEAEDGDQAWELYQENPIRLVITDWMMPGLSGIELCQKIRTHPSTSYTYIILMTALDDDGSVVQGFSMGADDYVAKNITIDILHARIMAGERIVQLQDKLNERNNELSQAYKTIQKDLKSAADMQQRLLPDNNQVISGFIFDWLYLPSQFISGDTLNCFPLGENRIAFYNLDVAGHGISSALLSVTLHHFITTKLNDYQRSITSSVNSPDYTITQPRQFVSALNERFASSDVESDYFTIFYGVADRNRSELKYCQAGHPSPILATSCGEISSIGGGGFPVGLMTDIEYEECTTKFNAGDRLYVYSDGVTEATNSANEMYGDERLKSFLLENSRQTSTDVLKSLTAVLHDWCSEDFFEDDVSIFAVELPLTKA